MTLIILRLLRDLTDLLKKVNQEPLGRTASVTIVRPKSGGNGCTYDLAERYRLMQSICRTRKAYSEADRSSAKAREKKDNKRKRTKKKITKRKGIGIILFSVYTPHYNLPSQHWMLYPFPFLYKKNKTL